MKQKNCIYENVTPTSMRDEGPGSGKRCGCCLVVSLSVLLFFSLMANTILAYFYVKLKWTSGTLSEQASECSAGDCNIKNVTVTSLEKIRRCSAADRQIQYKDRLYIFPADEMSWISSRVNCQELGGDLVIINSKEEHKFLVGAMNTFSNSLHWIGLRKAEKEGPWLWVDETPLMQNLFSKSIGINMELVHLCAITASSLLRRLSTRFWNVRWWKFTSEHSASEREDCVGYYDGQWVDLSCSTSERRICEIICTH